MWVRLAYCGLGDGGLPTYNDLAPIPIPQFPDFPPRTDMRNLPRRRTRRPPHRREGRDTERERRIAAAVEVQRLQDEIRRLQGEF